MATRGRPPKPETLIARAAVEAYQRLQGDQQAEPKGKTGVTVQARYNAAGMGRRLAGWRPPSSGPNVALQGLQTIRNRARDTSRNDWSGASGVQKWTTNLIGIGITPRFKRIKDARRKQELVDLWDDFVAVSDADCVLNFYGQQTLGVRTWVDAGEVFMRRRPRFADEGLPVPVQFQLLEPEMVPIFDSTSWPGMPDGNYIKMGVEFDKRGRRTAYWVYKQHPGDGMTNGLPDPANLVRVAASDMAHMFEPLRPGQIRGVSMLAPVITRLRTIEDYDDAVLTRQQIANLLVAFITRKLPPITGDEDLVGLTGQLPDEQDAAGRPLVGLQPGLVQTLDDGEEVQWSNPPEAGTSYSEYMRTQHLGTAAGTGLPYEIFSGDIANVSDRTLRVLINEFHRLAEQRQWQEIVPMFCVRAMTWFADAAVLVGKIDVSEYDDVRRATWAPHGWAYIHPVQDVQGKQAEVDAGFRSRASVIGERGDDPEQVDQERADDKERADKLGLTPVPAAGAPGNPNAPPGDPGAKTKPADPAAPKAATLEEIAALLKPMADQMQALQAKVEAVERGDAVSAQVIDMLGARRERTA